jgi:recombination protein RecT
MSTATPARRSEGGQDFLGMLQGSRDQIATLLPAHVGVDRVIRVARTAYMMDQKLQQCSPKSIMSAVMKACELGLEPSGALKHCYLVPFKGEATLIIGYAGLLELARRSKQYLKIETRLVYERDRFVLEYNPDPLFSHTPWLDGNAGPEKFVYAYARMKGGELAFEVMTRDQVEEIRRRLPEWQSKSPAWRDYWGEMARKVVLKRLLKRLPLSVDIADAIERDNEIERSVVATSRVELQPGQTRAEALADRLAPPRAIDGSTVPSGEFSDPDDAGDADAPVTEREPGEEG